MTDVDAKTLLHKLDLTVYGNGKKGLVTEVELLKENQTEIKWWVRGIGSVIIIYVVTQWLGLLKIAL